MTRLTTRLWVYLLVPLPIAVVCVSCYTWQLGYTADILAPVSFLAVCAVTFLLGALRR
jgi:hypothetical protein